MKLNAELRSVFIPILISFIIVILSISAFFALYLNKKFVAELYRIELRNLVKANNTVERTLYQVSTVARQINSDYQISKLLFSSELEPLEELISMNQLKSQYFAIPFLHSIYLYNAEINTFYMATAAKRHLIQAREEFFDAEAVQLLTREQIVNSGRPVFRTIPEEGSPVYTFLYHYLGNSASLPVSTVILNISAKWLSDQIQRLSYNDRQLTVIVDPTGRYIFRPLEWDDKRQSTITRHVDQMVADAAGREESGEEAAESGYFVVNSDGQRQLVTFHRNNSLNWILIRFTPYDNLVSSLRIIRLIVISATALFLVISVLISYLLSRRLYIPMRNAEHRLRLLEQEQGESTAILNRELLHSFLMEPDPDAHTFELPALAELGFAVDLQRPFQRLLFALDPNPKPEESEDMLGRHLWLQRELAIIRETLDKTFNNETFLFKGGLILSILQPCEDEQEDDALRLAAEELVALVARDLDTSFSVVFDPRELTLSEVAAGFSDIEDAMDFRFLSGPGAVIDMEDVRERRAQTVELTTDDEQEFRAALLAKKFEASVEICTRLLRNPTRATPRAVRNTAVRLIAVIHGVSSQKSISDPGARLSLPFLLREAGSCATLTELEEFFRALLQALAPATESESDSRSKKIVLSIENLIRGKYSDPLLSSVLIAEELGLSAPYVGRVFRQFTGATLPDYINRYRIERSKELLTTTELPVNTIFRRVGYNSASNFFTVFRKFTGLTPANYRWEYRNGA